MKRPAFNTPKLRITANATCNDQASEIQPAIDGLAARTNWYRGSGNPEGRDERMQACTLFIKTVATTPAWQVMKKPPSAMTPNCTRGVSAMPKRHAPNAKPNSPGETRQNNPSHHSAHTTAPGAPHLRVFIENSE